MAGSRRLWINHETDTSDKGHGGSELAWVEVRWGSSRNSKLAGRITVDWPRDDDRPTVGFTHSANVKEWGDEEDEDPCNNGHVRCIVCGECVTCGLRPCRDGKPHKEASHGNGRE